MPATSNGKFLPLLPGPPLPDTGWSVEVIAHTDLYAYSLGRRPTPLAKISRYLALSWSPEIGETGVGSITLALNDPVFSYALADGRTPDSLFRFPNLWVVYEDGQWRGEFFGEKRKIPRTPIDEAVGRTVTIAGNGAGQALARARVFSPYYPKAVPKGKIGVYQFKNQPVMASWITLLRAAQARHSIPFVRYKFTSTRDTGGAIWEDTPKPKPKNTAAATLGQVNFDKDSSALTTAGTKAVAALAAKIAKITYPVVTVTGHASSEGSKSYNYQKALDRANTVRNAILAIRPLAQITVVSKGETQPIASNRTEAGRKKNRRVAVTYQSSPAYVDTVFTPERGTTLLDLLRQLTSGQTMAQNRGPIHCEWLMRKNFELHVRPVIGVDRSSQVIFHEGSTALASVGDDYDSTEVANLIAVQNDKGVYRATSHPASIARWGQRELYTRIEGSYADAIHSKIAATQKLAYADEKMSTTMGIIAGPYRTPFRDFDLGDWIGIWRTRGKLPGAIDKQRVMAITVNVDANGQATYELKLTNTRTTRVSWLQLQVDALINRKQGIRSYISDDEVSGTNPGDLWTTITDIQGAG